MERIAVVSALAGIVWYAFRVKRMNDPRDYASIDVAHEPRISTVRFQEFELVDPVSYAAGTAAVQEFSRLFQETFRAKVSMAIVLTKMAHARQRMHREFHALRMWLPNDAAAERRLIAGIEETDAAMALAMYNVVRREPSVTLLHGAGILADPTVRAAGDTWD